MPVPIAVFDFEGTLYTHSGKILWLEIVKSQIKSHRLLIILPHILLGIVLKMFAGARIIDRPAYQLLQVKEIACLLKGLSQSQMKQLALTVTEKLKPQLRADIYEVLSKHQKQGFQIVLVSSIYQLILDIFGQELGIQFIIGTGLEFKDGACTGKTSGPVCIGENKARMLREFIDSRRMDVDLNGSYSYADSFSDRYVLGLCGQAVAVYPDKELRLYAQKHNWKIIGKSGIYHR